MQIAYFDMPLLFSLKDNDKQRPLLVLTPVMFVFRQRFIFLFDLDSNTARNHKIAQIIDDKCLGAKKSRTSLKKLLNVAGATRNIRICNKTIFYSYK